MQAESSKRLPGRPFVKGDPRAGRPKGIQNKTTVEIREFARWVLESAKYRKALVRRILAGEAQAIEQLLFFYAYGKPRERLEVTTHDISSLRVVLVEGGYGNGAGNGNGNGHAEIDITPKKLD